MGLDALIERRRRVMGDKTLLFYDDPLEFVRGSGVWLEDSAGRRYLDVYNNVPHVGHCHPHVVEALCRQAHILNVHTRYLNEETVRYAERLLAYFEDDLDVVSLVCTGTEANELALRMASHLSGQRGIIVTDNSYHGNSRALAEATTHLPAPEALAPHVRAIALPDPYRDGDPATLAQRYLDEVKAAIRSLQHEGFGVAAILFDTIFSTEGLIDVPVDFIRGAVKAVRKAGGFYIADEVQPGFGRMGDAMWGYQRYGIVPDFVTMGKPMGNGHPLAGCVTRRDYVGRFAADAVYFNTFGGNPVSAAVGNAVLDVIENEKLVENARAQGDYIQRGLKSLAERHALIGDVRGRGLFFGAEFVTDREQKTPATAETNRIVNRMKERGILISKVGSASNVLKMRPPIVFQQQHADLLLDTLDEVLEENKG